ncbi:hypothetical protein DFH28DRAFT_1093566 [Melampsora americana]|nr:hypothetical protein DFH28DRAFT_1093566 [Melampsora americana]
MAPRDKTNLLRPTNRLKKPRKEASKSSTSKELTEWEASEEIWCAKECNVLSRALTQPDEALRLPSTNNPQLNQFITGNEGYYDFEQEDVHTPIYEESESEYSDSDDSEHLLASDTDVGVVVNWIAGDYNRQRRIRGERQWEDILEPMFKVFMVCKLLTFDWSQSETWNFDTKKTCKCSVAKKRIRNLDFIDILTVDFCACQPDQVCLIQLGYIGGSPTQPEIAFSLRLLRLHDALWRFCSIRTHPFAQALEFFHREALGFVEDINKKPRRWGRQFSCAVDAYRRLFQVKEDLESRAMNLSKKEKLGTNCPRSFADNAYTKKDGEPDYVVCIDGNFQQRRHKSASVEVSEIEIRYPKLFLHPNQVNKWENIHSHSSNDVPDPCTQMHTAANDSRSASTWRACDDTGLLAMLCRHVCRHNHALAFVNIVQSGERSYFAHSLIDWLLKQLDEKYSTVGLLYDIGCNLEKGLIRVKYNDIHKLFEEEQSCGRFKFGTSVFHAYVHSWSCQLEYNPRLNHGWGLSDGEGSERCWCKLCKLVAALRYATKQH